MPPQHCARVLLHSKQSQCFSLVPSGAYTCVQHVSCAQCDGTCSTSGSTTCRRQTSCHICRCRSTGIVRAAANKPWCVSVLHLLCEMLLSRNGYVPGAVCFHVPPAVRRAQAITYLELPCKTLVSRACCYRLQEAAAMRGTRCRQLGVCSPAQSSHKD